MKTVLGDLLTEVEMPIFVLLFSLKCKITSLVQKNWGVYRGTEVPAILLQQFSLERSKNLALLHLIWLCIEEWVVARTSPQCRDVIFLCRSAPEI